MTYHRNGTLLYVKDPLYIKRSSTFRLLFDLIIRTLKNKEDVNLGFLAFSSLIVKEFYQQQIEKLPLYWITIIANENNYLIDL